MADFNAIVEETANIAVHFLKKLVEEAVNIAAHFLLKSA